MRKEAPDAREFAGLKQQSGLRRLADAETSPTTPASEFLEDLRG